MSSITARERPGVYSKYDASSVVGSGAGARTVGIAAPAASGTALSVGVFTSYAAALETYGAATAVCNMTSLIRLLFLNGANCVVAVPAAIGAAASAAQYESAFAKLTERDDVRLVVCGSGEADVHTKLKAAVAAACAERRDRIAVVGIASDTVTDLTARAAALNYERMVLAAPNALDADGDDIGGVYTAAALAGVLAAQTDPAVPLGGAELTGLGGLSKKYAESDIDLLIQGGVTPLENVLGTMSVIRGVTTRTTTGSAADATWRELTTILIVDDVIPTVRDSLRAKFARSKNTAQTRGAIRSQVIMELERKKTAEIIDGYGSVAVTQSEDDPTVCIVDFEFDVAHGLNQIHLYAHITV